MLILIVISKVKLELFVEESLSLLSDIDVILDSLKEEPRGIS